MHPPSICHPTRRTELLLLLARIPATPRIGFFFALSCFLFGWEYGRHLWVKDPSHTVQHVVVLGDRKPGVFLLDKVLNEVMAPRFSIYKGLTLW